MFSPREHKLTLNLPTTSAVFFTTPPIFGSSPNPFLSESDGHHRQRAERGKILPCRLPSSPIATHTARDDRPGIPRGSWIPPTLPGWRWCALHLDDPGGRNLKQTIIIVAVVFVHYYYDNKIALRANKIIVNSTRLVCWKKVSPFKKPTQKFLSTPL